VVVVVQVGDISGDGVPDMLVGDNEAYFTGFQDGAGYLFLLNSDGTAKDVLYITGNVSAFGGLVGLGNEVCVERGCEC
jgi:hypothetical protein